MRAARILRRVLGETRRTPATVCFLLLFWFVGLRYGGALHRLTPLEVRSWGFGVGSLQSLDVNNFFSSATVAYNPQGYLLTTLVLLVARPLERRWGTFRFVGAAVLAHAAANLVAVAITKLGSTLGVDWFEHLAHQRALGPVPFLLMLSCLSMAYYEPYLRRRVHVVTLITCSTLLLYSGLYEDLVRLCGVSFGVAGAWLLVRRRPSLSVAPASLRDKRMFVALVVVCSQLGPLLAAVSSSAAGPLAVVRYLFAAPHIEPAMVIEQCRAAAGSSACSDLALALRYHGFGPAVHSVLPVLLSAVLADGMRRGRRLAWRASIAAQGLLFVFGLIFAYLALVRPVDTDTISALTARSGAIELAMPALQPLIVIAVLFATRRYFDIASPGAAVRRALWIAVTSLSAAFIGFVAAVRVGASWFEPTPTITAAAGEFWLRLIPPGYLGINPPNFVAETWGGTLLLEWTSILVWCGLIIGAIRVMKIRASVRAIAALERARAILEQYGGGSLGYMTLWPQMSYWFDSTNSYYVSFRNDGSVALVLGGIIGPSVDRQRVLDEFMTYCDEEHLAVCFYGVSGSAVSDFARWQRIEIGKEAIVDLSALTFTGKRFQDVRTAINRARRDAVEASWLDTPSGDGTLDQQIEAMFDHDRADSEPELGFTIGSYREIEDTHVRKLIAIDANGVVHGLTSWLPVHEDGRIVGWSLDVMRRSEQAFNGAMEFMIASALTQFAAEGARVASLSAAPLAGLVLNDSKPSGALQLLGRALGGFYDFRSLLAFKAKFGPSFEPMYFVYRESTALPTFGNALATAYLPNTSLRELFGLIRPLR